MDYNTPSYSNPSEAEGLQNPGKCSPGTSISLTGIESICKAKKRLAALKSWKVLNITTDAILRDLSWKQWSRQKENISARLRWSTIQASKTWSESNAPLKCSSSTAATWDSKSTQLLVKSASLTTERFFSQRLMVSNLSAKIQAKKRKLIRNMKRLPPVLWRSSMIFQGWCLSPDLHFWDAHSFSAYLEELIDWSVSTWSSSVCFLATEDSWIPTPFPTSGAKLHLFIWQKNIAWHHWDRKVDVRNTFLACPHLTDTVDCRKKC